MVRCTQICIHLIDDDHACRVGLVPVASAAPWIVSLSRPPFSPLPRQSYVDESSDGDDDKPLKQVAKKAKKSAAKAR